MRKKGCLYEAKYIETVELAKGMWWERTQRVTAV